MGTLPRAAVGSLVADVFGRPHVFDVDLHELSAEHDIRLLVSAPADIPGIARLPGGRHAVLLQLPLQAAGRVGESARFEGERREFLAGVFRQAVKAKTWFHIDVDRAALAVDRGATAWCGRWTTWRSGPAGAQTAGVRHPYVRRKAPDDLDALAATLVART